MLTTCFPFFPVSQHYTSYVLSYPTNMYQLLSCPTCVTVVSGYEQNRVTDNQICYVEPEIMELNDTIPTRVTFHSTLVRAFN